MSDTWSRGEIKRRIQDMDPYEFEDLVAEVWEHQGYQTTVSKGSGDRGIDIEATKETPVPQKVLIQAKRYKEGNKVGAEEVRAYATLYQQIPDADTVIIVTSNDFTREAERIGKEQNVKTVPIESLIDLIIQSKIQPDLLNFDNETSSFKNTESIIEDNISREDIIEELEDELIARIESRSQMRLRWYDNNRKYTHMSITYKNKGIINRKFGVYLTIRPQLNKEQLKRVVGVTTVQNMQNVSKVWVEKENENEVSDELDTIINIIERTGGNLHELTVNGDKIVN